MLNRDKLESLTEFARLKKCANILFQISHDMLNQKAELYSLDYNYVNMVLSLCGFDPLKKETDMEKIRHQAFYLSDAASVLLKRINSEDSDWDFTLQTGELDPSVRIIQDKTVVLDEIRSPYNVGAIFRSADSFGVSQILLTEHCANPEHPHCRRTARGCINTVSWRYVTDSDLIVFLENESASGKDVMALELGGENLKDFRFASGGTVILGNEELGIRPFLLDKADKRIQIPMGGSKGSLNVSVSAGIFLCSWFMNSLKS